MASIEQVVERLTELIAVENLPDRTRGQTQRLLDRLETPLRVVFLGLSDSAQPKIINGLLGRDLVSAEMDRPPQQITFDVDARMVVTNLDGTRRSLVGEVDSSSIKDAMFVERRCNAPGLKRHSILDLAISGSEAEARSAIRWAASKADIAVWCSRTFSDVESRIWDTVPDSLKDHAFLALVDDRGGARSTHLADTLGGEFVNVIPVELEDGDAAPGDSAEPANGLRLLSAALTRHVDEGKHADSARAQLLLRKNQRLLPQKSAPQAAPLPPSTIAVKAGGEDFSKDADGINRDPEFQSALRDACASIKEQARVWLEWNADSGDLAANGFVTQCGDTIRHVSNILDSAPYSADPEKESLSDALLEAEEITVLLEIERSGTPDVDAACVLLQLRHELESRLAF